MEEKFIALMNKTLEVGEGSVEMNEFLESNPRFDSLGTLMILLMLEDEYGIIISSDEFQKFKYVKDLYDYVVKNATKHPEE
jgi:acyl carrier protein